MPSHPLPPVTRVGILAKSHLQAATPHLIELGDWLTARGLQPVFETATAALMPASDRRTVLDKATLATDVDMVLVLGGDGTLIGMADRIAEAGADTPVLGVNFGSLGFLTEVTLPELYRSLEHAVNGRAHIEERMMLRATTSLDGQVLSRAMALNDAVVTKTARSRMLDLSVYVGDDFVTRVRADGLIIATPTGSTAYNLAAGGPVLHPEMDAMVLNPICPFTLSNRPLVVPGSEHIDVVVEETKRTGVMLTVDGQETFILQADDRVSFTHSDRRALIYTPEYLGFYEVLREKLNWSGGPHA